MEAEFGDYELERLQKRSHKLPHLQKFHLRLFNLLKLTENMKVSVTNPIQIVEQYFEDIIIDYEDLLYKDDREYALAAWNEAESKRESSRDLKPFTNLLRAWLHHSKLRLHRPEELLDFNRFPSSRSE